MNNQYYKFQSVEKTGKGKNTKTIRNMVLTNDEALIQEAKDKGWHIWHIGLLDATQLEKLAKNESIKLVLATEDVVPTEAET